MQEIILNGLTAEELLQKIDALITLRLNEAIAKLDETKEEKLLSIDAACRVFEPKITRQTLYNYEKQGLIQRQQIGRAVYFKRSDVFKMATSLQKIIKTPLKVA